MAFVNRSIALCERPRPIHDFLIEKEEYEMTDEEKKSFLRPRDRIYLFLDEANAAFSMVHSLFCVSSLLTFAAGSDQ